MEVASGTNLRKKYLSGEVSEWLKEHAWKVCKRVKPLRGFESRPLRHFMVAPSVLSRR